MTRFGFGKKEFSKLAELIADCVLRGKDIIEDVEKLRSEYTDMRYCFSDDEVNNALEGFLGQIGF